MQTTQTTENPARWYMFTTYNHQTTVVYNRREHVNGPLRLENNYMKTTFTVQGKLRNGPTYRLKVDGWMDVEANFYAPRSALDALRKAL